LRYGFFSVSLKDTLEGEVRTAGKRDPDATADL
jgi:hypothetical protein